MDFSGAEDRLLNIAGMKRRFRIAGALLVSMVALFAFAGTAQAGWSAASTIAGSGPSATNSTVAGLADGRSVAAWIAPAGGQPAVYATRIDANGNAGPAVLISTSGQAAGSQDVIVAPGGQATIAWVNGSGTNDVIQSATFSAAGVAGPVVNRSASGAAGQDADAPKLAAANDGTIGMVWRKNTGTNWTVQSMVVSPAGSPSAVSSYAPLGYSSDAPDIAANPDPTPSAGTPATPTAPAVPPDPVFELAWSIQSGAVGNIVFVPLTAAGAPGDVGFVSTNKTAAGLCPKAATPANAPYVCQPQDMTTIPDSVQTGIDINGLVTLVWRQNVNRAAVGSPPDMHVTALSSFLQKQSVAVNNTTNVPPLPVPPVVANTALFISDKTDVPSQLDFAVAPSTRMSVVWKNDVPGSRWIETARLGVPPASPANSLATYWYVSPRLSNDLGAAYGFPRIAVAASGARTITWQQESAVPGVPDVQAMRLTPDGLFVGPNTLAPAGSQASLHAVPVMHTSGVSTVAFDLKDSGGNLVSAVSSFFDPGISITPETVVFGNDLLNIESPARSITIVDPGGTSNKVTGITVSGADADQFIVDTTTCIKEILPEAACLVEIEFRPTSAGAKTANVQITSEAGVRNATLTGTGVARTIVGLKVKPAKQALKRGKSVKVPVTLSNTGGIAASGMKVCAQGYKKVVRPAKRCVSVSSLAVGASRKLNFKVRLNGNAKAGKKYPVSFRLTAGNANKRIKYVKFALKGKKKKK